jgi:hypothetical protein
MNSLTIMSKIVSKRYGSFLDLNKDSDMKSTRRQFMMVSAASVAALSTAKVAYAQPMLAETNAQAVALGYKENVKDVDSAKFPKYKAGQFCNNCQLYAAKSDNAGACSIFPGKLVASEGWCNLWVKKAG